LLATSVAITGSQCSDRHEVKPWPIFGGEPGGNGATLIRKADSAEWKTVRELYGKISSSKFANITLEPGDRILLVTPGGGGYGDPTAREPEAVAEDVREGYVSAEAAAKSYGYAFDNVQLRLAVRPQGTSERLALAPAPIRNETNQC
jgi:N-methylhydantoinase B/oxoprolinase/acetone carboxylase alpha subunit